jgi:hypothetical protein
MPLREAQKTRPDTNGRAQHRKFHFTATSTRSKLAEQQGKSLDAPHLKERWEHPIRDQREGPQNST